LTLPLFFGRNALQRIRRIGRARHLRATRVPVDYATEDVEAHCAACEVLKGSRGRNGSSRAAQVSLLLARVGPPECGGKAVAPGEDLTAEWQ